MKKRLTALALAMMMVFMVGCSDDDDGGAEKTGDRANKEQESVVTLGEVNGNTYISRYMGIACEFDSDWILADATELQDLSDMTVESMEGTTLGDAMADYTQIMDLSAESGDYRYSMNVVLTKLPKREQKLYAEMTEEELIDYNIAMGDLMVEALEAGGITVNGLEKVFVTFLGERHAALLTSAHIGAVEYYCLQLYFYDIGEYGAVLSLCSYGGNYTEDLLDMFYSVK